MIDFNFAGTIKGFMDNAEAVKLYETALEAAEIGPCLEIGSFCGKSAYFIGMACKKQGSILFSVDHHRGSEEHQPGEEYFDPDLAESVLSGMFCPESRPLNSCLSVLKKAALDLDDSIPYPLRINTFNIFRETIEAAGLEDVVVPVVAKSIVAGRMWATPVSMVFIDGGHSFEAAENDYITWTPHIMDNGFLVIHDIFTDENKGGQAPRYIYEKALDSGVFNNIGITGTLGILKKIVS